MKFFQILIISLFCTVSMQAKTRKTVFVVLDGIPADVIERVSTPAIDAIARKGVYGRAFTGGEIGSYSETPTISAIGYTNMLTGTWMNKHNVHGNSDLEPNYNYWTLFRIAKEQPHPVTTAIYSSWTDNRTVLLGENKPETNYLAIDYVKDGYDLDTLQYPVQPDDLHIFEIDERISKEAAEGIRQDAPDMSWVYLWYTDDASHIAGNSEFFDEYVRKADNQVMRIWEAVQYREANFDEEWFVIITTDHGRTDSGYGHGGQSQRERTTWISTNQKVNRHFKTPSLAITDIAPSVCRFMNFHVPQPVLWEQDGVSFIGETDVCDLIVNATPDSFELSWKAYNPHMQLTVYAATSNQFKRGKKDGYIKLHRTLAGVQKYTIDRKRLAKSRFYKFVIVSPENHACYWVLE